MQRENPSCWAHALPHIPLQILEPIKQVPVLLIKETDGCSQDGHLTHVANWGLPLIGNVGWHANNSQMCSYFVLIVRGEFTHVTSQSSLILQLGLGYVGIPSHYPFQILALFLCQPFLQSNIVKGQGNTTVVLQYRASTVIMKVINEF